MNLVETTRAIEAGEVSLGIELGSLIKRYWSLMTSILSPQAVMFWENRFEDGVWTYPIDEVWTGIQQSYTQMAADVQSKYHSALTRSVPLGSVP